MSSYYSSEARVAEERRAAAMKAARERAELERARTELETFRREIEALSAADLDVGEMTLMRGGIDRMEPPAATRQIREYIANERARIMSRVTRLKLDLGGADDDISVATAFARQAADGARTEEAGEAGETDDPGRAINEAIGRYLGRLRPDAIATDRMREVLGLARDHEAAGGRRRIAVDALAREVDEANAAALARERVRERTGEAAGLLAGFNTAEAIELRRRMDDPDLDPDRALLLLAEAKQVHEQAVREWDREYIARTLAEALEEEGVTVEDGFETELLTKGRARAANSRWDGYSVRTMWTYDGGISMEILRAGRQRGDQAARDREVEQEWCDGLKRVEDRIRKGGVTISNADLRDVAGGRIIRDDPEFEAAPDRTRKRVEPQREIGGDG